MTEKQMKEHLNDFHVGDIVRSYYNKDMVGIIYDIRKHPYVHNTLRIIVELPYQHRYITMEKHHSEVFRTGQTVDIGSLFGEMRQV